MSRLAGSWRNKVKWVVLAADFRILVAPLQLQHQLLKVTWSLQMKGKTRSASPNPAAATEGRGFSRSEDSIVISLLISLLCRSSKQTVQWVQCGGGAGGDFPIKWIEHKGEEQAVESFIKETGGLRDGDKGGSRCWGFLSPLKTSQSGGDERAFLRGLR